MYPPAACVSVNGNPEPLSPNMLPSTRCHLHFAASERILTKAIAYIVETPDWDSENFISFLKQTGYEVKSKIRKVRADKSTKGD